MSTASTPDTPAGERVCLAAEGFGNRACFLQSTANKVYPITINNIAEKLMWYLNIIHYVPVIISNQILDVGEYWAGLPKSNIALVYVYSAASGERILYHNISNVFIGNLRDTNS